MKIFEQLAALLSQLMEDSWNPARRQPRSPQKYDLQKIKDYLDLQDVYKRQVPQTG